MANELMVPEMTLPILKELFGPEIGIPVNGPTQIRSCLGKYIEIYSYDDNGVLVFGKFLGYKWREEKGWDIQFDGFNWFWPWWSPHAVKIRAYELIPPVNLEK